MNRINFSVAHTFLYTGSVPSIEKSKGTYPIVVVQKNGKKVPVVQAYAFTKYLGRINLIVSELTKNIEIILNFLIYFQFDSEGNLVKFDGAPILLDSSIPEDPAILKILELYRPGVTTFTHQKIGSTKVFLDGNCRQNECNLGNFIADSMVHWYASRSPFREDNFWTDASIGLLHSGGIRTSIDHRDGSGMLTKGDTLRILPFGDKIMVVEVTGEELLEALEHSVYE